MPGNPSWRLGAHFSDFCDFGDLSGTKKESLFEVIFDTFCIHFLVFFLECSFFSDVFEILGDQRLHFGRFFGTFLETLGHWKNSSKCVTISKFRGLARPNWIIFGDFFKSALRNAS